LSKDYIKSKWLRFFLSQILVFENDVILNLLLERRRKNAPPPRRIRASHAWQVATSQNWLSSSHRRRKTSLPGACSVFLS